MKIAIIGAGVAGLCAGRHCLDHNLAFDIFEQTGKMGGTWTYTDETGCDENGVPIHTSMYQDLRVNIPKELMMVDEIPYKGSKSYIGAAEVLQYIEDYERKFNIKPYIKFYTLVESVEPENSGWYVSYRNVRDQTVDRRYYDAVMVCNGHFKQPFVPIIPGVDNFLGKIIHSHDYRKRDSYKGKKVLVIGGSFSGLDIAQLVQTVAEKVVISHTETITKPVNENIIKKGLVTKLDATKAYFDNDDYEEIDNIIFATGYLYDFPFLTPDCGIKVTDNWVSPLYKQVINIEHPTMALIGLPFFGGPFTIFGIQIRFFLASVTKHFELPTKDEMLKELKKETESKSHLPLKKWHALGEYQDEYFKDLSSTACIPPVPSVIHKLYIHVRYNTDKERSFRLIDDDNFEEIRLLNSSRR